MAESPSPPDNTIEINALIESILKKHYFTFGPAFKTSQASGMTGDLFKKRLPKDNDHYLALLRRLEAMSPDEAFAHCEKIRKRGFQDLRLSSLHQLEEIERYIESLLAMKQRDSKLFNRNANKSRKFTDQMLPENLALYKKLMDVDAGTINELLLTELREKISLIQDPVLKRKTCQALETLCSIASTHTGFHGDARRQLREREDKFKGMTRLALLSNPPQNYKPSTSSTSNADDQNDDSASGYSGAVDGEGTGDDSNANNAQQGDMVIHGFCQNVGGAKTFSMEGQVAKARFGKFGVMGILEHMWSTQEQKTRAFPEQDYLANASLDYGLSFKPCGGSAAALLLEVLLKFGLKAKEMEIQKFRLSNNQYVSAVGWEIEVDEDFSFCIVHSYATPGVSTGALRMYLQQIVGKKPYLINVDANMGSASDVKEKNAGKQEGEAPDLGYIQEFLDQTNGIQANNVTNVIHRLNELLLTNMVVENVKQALYSAKENLFNDGLHRAYEYIINITKSKQLYMSRQK